MRLSIKPSLFITNFIWTTLASVSALLANIFILRFLIVGLGAEQFGAYALAHRLIANALPLATWAMGIALPRYVAMADGEVQQQRYLMSGFLITMIATLIIVVFSAFFSGPMTLFLFRNINYEPLFLATCFLFVFFSLYTVINAFYFGSGKVRIANFWQFAITVLGMLVIAKVFAPLGKASNIIYMFGILYLVASIPLFVYLIRSMLQDGVFRKIKQSITDLLVYGFPRILDGFLATGLATICLLLSSRLVSLEAAGYFAIGLCFFRIVEMGTGAFGQLVLPKTSQLLSEGSGDILKERIQDVVSMGFQVGLFFMLHLWLWSDLLIHLWLGEAMLVAIPITKILVLSTGPYLIFVLLRPILDGIQKKPINTWNLLISFSFTLLISLITVKYWEARGLALATTLGFTLLAVLSAGRLVKIYGFKVNLFQTISVIGVNLVFITSAYGLKILIEQSFSEIFSFGLALLVEGVFVFLYYMLLKKLQINWIFELEKRLFASDKNTVKEI